MRWHRPRWAASPTWRAADPSASRFPPSRSVRQQDLAHHRAAAEPVETLVQLREADLFAAQLVDGKPPSQVQVDVLRDVLLRHATAHERAAQHALLAYPRELCDVEDGRGAAHPDAHHLAPADGD